ncbi:MAG: DsbA family protein [Actinobacteria bacterium]|nr:DsbA family protein [Actinomycetota bacterium]
MVEVFADIWCPFAYVGISRFFSARHESGSSVTLKVRAWPLELVNGSPPDPVRLFREIDDLRRQVAPDLFSRVSLESFPSTMLPALALESVAYQASGPVGESVTMSLRRALFEEGLDISEESVLADVAQRHGLAMPDATSHKDLVEVDYSEGKKRGVKGSPQFFIDQEGYFCPTLNISAEANHLRVSFDYVRFEEFLKRAFG